MTSEQRMVIFASSLGTVFEWYDFYIYGTLGVFLAKYFFSNVPANVGFIFALLAFAAGFAVRPFGALIFGRIGDMIGRKYTFLVTMSLMGVGTFFIGVLPGYASWGIAAPIVLIGLRLVQGLALGGEYGGAAIYVAEHAPKNKRGFYTSWIQTTATLGLFMALLLILGIRTAMGEQAFGDWGWRIPFLLSAILLAVSIWIRLKLNESPLFQKMVAEGKTSKRPLTEAFGRYFTATYATRLAQAAGGKFTVKPQSEARGANRVVQTEVANKDGDTSQVDFLVGSGNRVQDVYLNGNVSELASLRGSFAEPLKTGGADGLLTFMRDRTTGMLAVKPAP